jgi:stage II sporulation protein M
VRLLRALRLHLDGYLDRYGGTFLLLSAFFVAGVVFGALAVGSLGVRDKQELVQYLRDAGHALHTGEGAPDGAPVFARLFTGHLKRIALIWAMGILVIGAAVVVAVAFLRGFVTGFVVGFLTAELGWKGVLLAAAAHLPQSLLEVPVLLLAGTASVGFSGMLFRALLVRRRLSRFYAALLRYTAVMLLAALAMAAVALIQLTVTPGLTRLALRLQ